MAIINKSTSLTAVNPVYNPLVYVFDSSNKNAPGFRYVIDIYSGSTSVKIFEGRVAPRPIDGFGYIDVSKIISNYINFDIDLTGTTSIDAVNSFFNYTIKIGEESVESWPFTDTFFYNGITNVSGATNHNFVTGDQVNILQNNVYIPQLEGLQTVYTALTSNSFIVDVAHISSAPNTGIASYADGRRLITRDILTYASQVAFNSAYSSSEWISYDPTKVLLGAASTTNKMLTNIPDNFYCSKSQDLFLNGLLANGAAITQVKFQNDAGDLFYKAAGSFKKIKQYAVGPNNLGALTLISGTPILIKPNTKYYDVWLSNDGGFQVCKKVRIYINSKCAIEDYEILFLDRKGSFVSFSFPLLSETSQKGDRVTYNKQIGDLVNGKWGYNNSDSGEITTSVSFSEDIKLRTDFITSEMAIYFSELIFSPVTYVKIGGKYYNCIVNTNSYNPQSLKYKKLNKQEVTIRLSNQNPINI